MTDGKLGVGTQAAYDAVREKLNFIADDHEVEMYNELEKITNLLLDGSLLEAVEEKVNLDLQ